MKYFIPYKRLIDAATKYLVEQLSELESVITEFDYVHLVKDGQMIIEYDPNEFGNPEEKISLGIYKPFHDQIVSLFNLDEKIVDKLFRDAVGNLTGFEFDHIYKFRE